VLGENASYPDAGMRRTSRIANCREEIESALHTSEKIRERVEWAPKSRYQSIAQYLRPIDLLFLVRLNGHRYEYERTGTSG
jgi:hypothetical protein